MLSFFTANNMKNSKKCAPVAYNIGQQLHQARILKIQSVYCRVLLAKCLYQVLMVCGA